MDIEEALNWTDDRVFAKTGKHLDSLQIAILEGVWQRETYETIGDKKHCSKHHVRKEAWELWQILSNVLGEDVKKSNVRAIVENGLVSYFNDGFISNNINFCNDVPIQKRPKNALRPRQIKLNRKNATI